jgi:uncharacterized protein
MNSKPAEETEMSMEEILASIRRYVADDGPETNLSEGEFVSGRTAEVIRLTEALESNQSSSQSSHQQHRSHQMPQEPIYSSPQSSSPSYKETDPMYDKTRQSYTYEQTPHPGGYQHEPQKPMSDHTTQASASAFSRLADAVKSANTPTHQAPEQHIPHTSASPLEDLMIEMIRPMIRNWMDQHLPEVVERLVSKEIEKITTELNKSLGR